MPSRSRVLRVAELAAFAALAVLAVLAVLNWGGCDKTTSVPSAKPPVEPEPRSAGGDARASDGVELHYAKTLRPMRTEVVTEFAASQYHEDVEGTIAFAAEVEIADDGRDLTLRWHVLSVDAQGSETPWGPLDGLAGTEGTIAMGPRGQDPKPSPPPTEFAGKDQTEKVRLYETVSGAFTLPLLPDARLEVGKPFVEKKQDAFAVGEGKVPVQVEVEYLLVGIETVDGVELATLEITGFAEGEVELESITAEVEQTTDVELLLGLADGIPRRFTVAHEQSVSYGDEETAYKYSVAAKFAGHE